jgi:ubiquitin C-terminal hydrolase
MQVCFKWQEEMIYELYGIVEHQGEFYYGGHYVCNIRSSPTSWHLFDDSKASPYSFSFLPLRKWFL